MFNLIEFLYLRQKGNLVYYDSLTGVRSRKYYDMVAKKKYHGCETKVAFIDVDNLKQVNDHEGHFAGSQLLKELGAELQRRFGDCDICRIGGDEFIVIGSFDDDALTDLAGVSVGLCHKEAYEDLSSAVQKADERMYLEKERRSDPCRD